MDVTPLIPQGKKVITGYGKGGFVINNERIAGDIIITPDQVLTWQVKDHSRISKDDLAAIARAIGHVDIMLIGCGEQHYNLEPRVMQEIRHQFGLNIDIMSTSAACRTYNVLLAENREIAAALIAV